MIDKKEFKKQNFASHGIIESNISRGIGKVPKNFHLRNNDHTALRENIRDIMWDKSDEYRLDNDDKTSDYNIIEICCRIPTDTMKALNGKYKLTRNFLAKFTVGLKLDLDIANSLFSLHSGELNLTNDFDYIVYHALKTKDDINHFTEEVYEYLEIKLDKDK